jgi:hypothetical protein
LFGAILRRGLAFDPQTTGTSEVRIMGSKSVLLRTLVAASSAKTVGFGVTNVVPKWRAAVDEDGHYSFAVPL